MKRLFAFFLALCLLFSMLPLTASAATEGTCDDGHHVPGLHFIDKETGYCGNCGIPCHSNGTTVWAIEEDGTMIIYGTGENGAGRLDYYGFLWDDYADQVTSLIVEEGVTGQIFGFSLFENLVSVSLPEGITSIQNGCFGACTSLEQVNFPSTLTELGSNSFQDCAKLKEVYLPAALSSFGARPFGGCTNLTGIWVDEENPNFTNDKFGVLFNKDMTLLEEAPGALSGNYVIPETVTSISWAAFDGCTKLTGVEIPDGVTMLEMELFKNCTSLKTFTIPASVTSMWMDVFRGCTGLETIFFEGDAPAMDGAFNGVTATAYYPAENETWTEDVMQYCGGTITWVAYEEEESIIASGICGDNLTWIVDSKGVLTISGTGAMYDFEEEPPQWWHHKDSYDTIVLEDGVTSIGRGAFASSYFTSITIPDSVTSIGAWAFNQCFNLKSIVIPDSVTEIGERAFFFSQDLESVTLPASLTSIGTEMFRQCYSLKSITIPDGVESIGERAFYMCDDLTGSITIPEGATIIGSDAFWGCSNLESITIPDSVTSIGSGAFCCCSSLTSITIPDSVISIEPENLFSGCNSLTSITIPEGVTIFDWFTFGSCSSLVNFTIPNSVTTIGEYVFSGCSALESLTIPENVTSVGYSAFSRCSSLTDLTFTGDAPSFDPDAFQNVATTVYYPAGNDTWTEDVMQQYGGTITWMAQLSAPSVQVANVASSGKPKLTWDKVEGAKNYKVYRSTDGGVTYSLLITTTGTSLTNTSAATGTKYYYYVVAVSESGVESGKSNTVYRVCDLPRPTVTVTLNSSGNPKLSWTKIDGATQYKVYRSTDGGATYSLLKTTTGTSLTNTSVTAGTKYYYKVYAVHSNSSANSAYSTVVSIACKLATPAVKVSNVASSGKIKLTWDKVEGASKYNVYRSANGGTTYSLLTTTSGTSLTNTSATAGSKYYYYIVAVSASGVRSEKSNTVYRVCDLPRPVVKVTNVASTGKIKLTWDKIDGAKSYKVYRSTDGGVTYSLLSTTSGTSLTNTSATAGSKYYYKVFAVHSSNSSANSAYSSVVSGVCDLPRPTLTVTLNSAGNPKLSWTKIDGAVKYQVYRSTDGKAWSLLKTTTGTSLTNTSAVSGTTYYYRVLAIAENSTANSAYSTVKSITAG